MSEREREQLARMHHQLMRAWYPIIAEDEDGEGDE